MKDNMNIPAILHQIGTPLQFAALALIVFIYGLAKVRSNKQFIWLIVFSGVGMIGGLWLYYSEKSPSPPASISVTNTGQGGVAVGTNSGVINVGGVNGK
jgi:hypothetical protein